MSDKVVTPSEAVQEARSLDRALSFSAPLYGRESVTIVCADCDQECERKPGTARRCFDCQEKRDRILKTRAQRSRRSLKAGLTYVQELPEAQIRITRAVKVPCPVCGVEIQRERTTRVYCSVKCRVAHHRAKAANA